MKLHIIVAKMFIIIVSLTACTNAIATVVENPTETPEFVTVLTELATEMPTPAPTFTPTFTPEPTATNTLVPTATPTPPPTATPEPVAQIDPTLTAPVNVRSGPGVNYPIIARFEPGQEAPVTGRNEDNSWWQVMLSTAETTVETGWVFGELVAVSGSSEAIPIVQAPPPPATPTPAAQVADAAEQTGPSEESTEAAASDEATTPQELAEELRCGKDFCVTYQAMVPIWENGGCVGNHSIYITVLQGLPPGKPLDGIVIGDTFNNVEVASGSHGPGRTEITLWNNSMTLVAKRHIDGTPYTSEESFNFTSHDELIPADVLAASGYCEGRVEKCREAQQHNQVCRGHYSWRVTFHKFD